MTSCRINGVNSDLLAAWARALGGIVQGGQVLCPGPGHSAADRSLSVRPVPQARHGFLLHSFAGDDFESCRQYVCARLGLHQAELGQSAMPSLRVMTGSLDQTQHERIAAALKVWGQSEDPVGTVVESYLASRRLHLDTAIGAAIRFHPGLPIDGTRLPAMIALLRDVMTDKPCGIHRTWLDQNSNKVARRMLGRAKHAAVKLDPASSVSGTLTIGEGVETSLAARRLGCSPVWAVGSAVAVQAFPVLDQIKVLKVLGEHDVNGANLKAAEIAAERWLRAGRKVYVYMPPSGDMNDLLMKTLS